MKFVFLKNTLYATIKQNKKLAEKRNPMFEQNRFAKVLIYFMVAFWLAYLVMFGVMFPFIFEGTCPAMEPYHIMNRGLLIILLLDFGLRLWVQPTPSQEVKPYLLMPVRRSALVRTFLLQSGLDTFNLFWMALFLPFGFLTIIRFYGFLGLFTYLLGCWLLIVTNNYWTQLCKTLTGEHTAWLALPLGLYALLAVVEFVPDGHLISTFTMNLGEGYILGSAWAFLLTLAGLVAIFLINQKVQCSLIRQELGHVKDTKMKRVSEYRFLDRFGEIGDYLRLELKLTARNKTVRSQMRMGAIMMLFFIAISFFSDVYDGQMMTNFVCGYCYVVMGLINLAQVMTYEGNYLDGLMARKEIIYNLLRAKYYFNCLLTLIPFLLMMVLVFKGKLPIMKSVGYFLFTIGPTFCMVMQAAVINKKTMPLNATAMKTNKGSSMAQGLITSTAMFVPYLVGTACEDFLPEGVGYYVLAAFGLVFVITHEWWLKNIYRRFMKRRYVNMEGYRSTRN
jgi:hypothetical protein